MQEKIIKLRKPLTIIRLIYHLNRFFNLTNFSTEYVGIQTKINVDKKESLILTLGNYNIININNEVEITKYIDHVIDHYCKLDIKDVVSINFCYLPLSRKEYETENYILISFSFISKSNFLIIFYWWAQYRI